MLPVYIYTYLPVLVDLFNKIFNRFNKMASIFVGVPIVFNVFSFKFH